MITVAAIILTGCVPSTFAVPPFVRQAEDAASSLSAAATTLEFLHDGKLDSRYASSSLVVYQQALTGVASILPGEDGAPDEATLQPVLEQFERAQAVLDDPCLSDECDWQSQIETLNAAKDALLEVS